MLFCGKYEEKVNNTIPLRYNLNGKVCNVLCVEENEYITFMAICMPESNFEAEAYEYGNVICKENVALYDTVKLPEVFLRYIDCSDVVVLGCGDRIEIHKKSTFLEPLDKNVKHKIVDEIVKNFPDF